MGPFDPKSYEFHYKSSVRSVVCSTEPTLTTPDDPDGESSRSASSQRLPSPEYLGNSSSSSDIYIYNTHICTQFRGLSSNHKDLLLSLVDFRMNIYEHMIAISTLGRRTRTKCFLVSQPSLPERGLFLHFWPLLPWTISSSVRTHSFSQQN